MFLAKTRVGPQNGVDNIHTHQVTAALVVQNLFQRDRQRERQRDRQTDRQTDPDRQTDRQTDRPGQTDR
jgi:hypothetical protein